ncbi:MAG: hypothetical protein KC454_08250 [Flavobacteriales bacterium]|nr:hypothetical protein [Flavobacteriales bacterium]
MKKLRILKRSMALLFGVLGLATAFSSCHKERTCNCTQSNTFSSNGSSSTYSQEVIKKTEQKCWELNQTTETSSSSYYGPSTSTQTIVCD